MKPSISTLISSHAVELCCSEMSDVHSRLSLFNEVTNEKSPRDRCHGEAFASTRKYFSGLNRNFIIETSFEI